jgi:FSR family fosmidomycin resistance protein-like MFS transporter
MSGAATGSGVFRLASIYGAIHALVDLSSVSASLRASRSVGLRTLSSFQLVLGYDLLAFGLQFPLGLLVDRLRSSRAALLAGLLLIAASIYTVPVSALATMILAGVGNALFHLGGGAPVLAASGGRAEPAGIFVAPGALGLGLGIFVGRRWDGPIWPLGPLLGAAFAIAAVFRVPAAVPVASGVELDRREWSVALAALLLSVAVRSFVGFGGPYQVPKLALLVVGLPLCAFGGKLFGGVIADRAGWLETSVGALLLSAPLIVLGGSSPVSVLLGMLLFQATMPVTLTAAYLLMPDRPATAFGLPCLALIAGAVPTFYPVVQAYYGPHTFLALILASTVAIAVALNLLGIRLGHRPTPMTDARFRSRARRA